MFSQEWDSCGGKMLKQKKKKSLKKKTLHRILGGENSFLDLGKRKELEKDKKREDSIIKDVKNLFRRKKEIDDNKIKSIRNLFRLKKENEAIKDRIIRDIRNLFEQEKEDYYKPVRVGNFWSRNYIEYESN